LVSLIAGLKSLIGGVVKSLIKMKNKDSGLSELGSSASLGHSLQKLSFPREYMSKLLDVVYDMNSKLRKGPARLLPA